VRGARGSAAQTRVQACVFGRSHLAESGGLVVVLPFASSNHAICTVTSSMRPRSYERTWLQRRDAVGLATTNVHGGENAATARPVSDARIVALAATPAGGAGLAPRLLTHLLRHSPQLFSDVRVAAADKGITSLDELPRRYTAAKTVFLANNKLHSLRGIEQFADARVLTLAHNAVARFEELEHLGACRQLQQLTLHDTPLAARPLYRARTIAVLHALGVPVACLDGAAVSAADVAASELILQRHAAVLAVLVSQECRIAQLALVVQLLQVHQELVPGSRRDVAAPRPPVAAAPHSAALDDGTPFRLEAVLR